ncbi:class I SAM-dependent methyltransferase [Herbaspirillum lusitanum]|uniref:Eco57I restriction-modification methylase domain-containing protein n=1 Tax=Herbaspirillum lusitanum TaxID=213312 RepID=UPI0022373C75|nr:N-6 DNA methylase [Herbaspirillum lusitanum]MCW5297289.1 class I SAM-dependent methyltransferase [Herbaspirillum lusitanum]
MMRADKKAANKRAVTSTPTDLIQVLIRELTDAASAVRTATHRIDGYGLAANSNYLEKCQVDTPPEIVKRVWEIVRKYRTKSKNVFDAGAGDGRFSVGGVYDQYIGYELDSKRIPIAPLPENATILRACAFAQALPKAFDLAIGNPPYVRHHDLSDTWRERISKWIKEQTGVTPNGWSNAYLYFLWLALITTKNDGLVAYLVPFDWVTRPAARTLREFIANNEWQLDIYRFDTEPFPGVLTTACIVIVDKQKKRKSIQYYRLPDNGDAVRIDNPTLSSNPPLEYVRKDADVYAQRGFSSGDQTVFLLTESQRLHHGLEIGEDVVAAVSSLREVSLENSNLTEAFFKRNFVDAGESCWLVRPTDTPSKSLMSYLNDVGGRCKNNSTCSKRAVWWKYELPVAPRILYASGFRGPRPKLMLNTIGAIAVGSVCGIYTPTAVKASHVLKSLLATELQTKVVALSRGFTKIEVNQMNGLLRSIIA